MDAILEELKTIRRYIGIGVGAICCALLVYIVSVYYSLHFVRPYKQLLDKIESRTAPSDTLQSKATERLMAGDFSSVLRLTDEQEKKYPNDPNIFYYRGLAYKGLNDHKNALENFEKAQNLAPSWKSNFTGPEIKNSRKALGLSEEQ